MEKQFWTAVAERSGDDAFARTKRRQAKKGPSPQESGNERATFQMLADRQAIFNVPKRLECGAFSTAFDPTRRN